MNNVFKNNSSIPMKLTPKKNNMVLYILGSVVVVLILLFIIMCLNYLLTDCYDKKDFGKYLSDFDFEPCVSKYAPSSLKERELKDEEEVFHIGNQAYTYNQAKCKCAAYGARLAKYPEIVNSYNKGGEWCSYGWSQGQNAYYPTQKCTWDKLQKGPRRWRNSCGEPGVNGGFFSNPNLKFGVNCYGVKPKGQVVVPKRAECKHDFCKRRENRRSNEKLETDEISPFNPTEWSSYN